MTMYSPQAGNYSIARAYYDSGLSIIALRCDGSKQPRHAWKRYSEDRCPWYRLQYDFTSLGRPSGIAILCGQTSGNLEVIDFDRLADETFLPWCEQVESLWPDC